jgi:hypothetical protein
MFTNNVGASALPAPESLNLSFTRTRGKFSENTAEAPEAPKPPPAATTRLGSNGVDPAEIGRKGEPRPLAHASDPTRAGTARDAHEAAR